MRSNEQGNNYRKTIFIGSSSEALEIVAKVEAMLHDEYEILRWDESFTQNKSTLDCLVENAIKVDEAIFIGTADDNVLAVDGKRAEREGALLKHRDNVVFEFGLFLGMLGRKDCVYLVDSKSTLMSDYKGITVKFFDRNSDKSLADAVIEIKKHFKTYSNRDINLFPSATLASGYFINFIQPIFNHYQHNGGKIKTNIKSYRKCEITVVLPSRITDDLNKQFEELKNRVNTRSELIEYLGRSRTISVDVTSKKDELKIVDFPTTLLGIRHAVYSLLPDEQKKTTPDYDAIFRREIRRFAETLNVYIKEASCQSIAVVIKNEDTILSNISKPRKKIFGISFRRNS